MSMALSPTGYEEVREKRRRIDDLIREGVRRQISTELLSAARSALDAAENCIRMAEIAESSVGQ